jgi:hypothetical protein
VMEFPGVAEPTVWGDEDPPSLSDLLIERFACDVTESVSEAVTDVASEAEAVTESVYEFPVAVDGTIPANWRVTWEPGARVAKVQVLVVELKVTPEGRLGLEVLVKPWAGRVSATLTFTALEGPVLEATIVYVSVVPATTELTPSVVVTARFAWVVRLSVSLVLTMEASAAEAEAVFR